MWRNSTKSTTNPSENLLDFLDSRRSGNINTEDTEKSKWDNSYYERHTSDHFVPVGKTYTGKFGILILFILIALGLSYIFY